MVVLVVSSWKRRTVILVVVVEKKTIYWLKCPHVDGVDSVYRFSVVLMVVERESLSSSSLDVEGGAY